MASLSDKILLLAHFFWRAAYRGLIGFLFFYCLCFSMLWFILFQEQYVHVCVVEVQRKRQKAVMDTSLDFMQNAAPIFFGIFFFFGMGLLLYNV